MAKRILIVGATGMLGIPVARKLKDAGFIVRILARDVAKARKLFTEEYEVLPGDLIEPINLVEAMNDCKGIHINLSGDHEHIGVESIVKTAMLSGIERISYISGTSVSKANTWVPVIQRKYYAEEIIRESGIPYTIYCPTWFMEVIPKYIKDGRAVVFGKQPNHYHFIAADDYAMMVAKSYSTDEAINKRFVVHGPEGIFFTNAVDRYRQHIHPEIDKVMNMPYWMASIISRLKKKPEMKAISDWMKAFEKIGELGDPSEANSILGAPQITLENWIKQGSKKHN